MKFILSMRPYGNKGLWIGTMVLLSMFFYVDFSLGGSAGSGTFNFRSGRTISIASGETIKEDLIAAAAEIEISGKLEKGLKAFGANVNIPGEVGGEAMAFGANVILPGTYHGKLRAGGANVVLSGTFNNHVEVAAARVTVAPTAVIMGDLTYSAAVFERQKGSRITGKLIKKGAEQWKTEMQHMGERTRKISRFLAILWLIVSIPALIILGSVIHYLSPQTTDLILAHISKSPWKSTLIGFIFLVAFPAAVIISFITIVGIPIGIIAGLLYGALLYISRIYISVWIGRRLLGYLKSSSAASFFWPLVVGVIVTAFLYLIPYAGRLFRLFFLLISLGAIWLSLWRSIQLSRHSLRP